MSEQKIVRNATCHVAINDISCYLEPPTGDTKYHHPENQFLTKHIRFRGKNLEVDYDVDPNAPSVGESSSFKVHAPTNMVCVFQNLKGYKAKNIECTE